MAKLWISTAKFDITWQSFNQPIKIVVQKYIAQNDLMAKTKGRPLNVLKQHIFCRRVALLDFRN